MMENSTTWEKPEITILFEGEVQEHVMAFRISSDGDPDLMPPPTPGG